MGWVSIDSGQLSWRKWYLSICTQEFRNTGISEIVIPQREKAQRIKPFGILKEKLQDQQSQSRRTKTVHTEDCEKSKDYLGPFRQNLICLIRWWVWLTCSKSETKESKCGGILCNDLCGIEGQFRERPDWNSPMEITYEITYDWIYSNTDPNQLL